jgi:hypothetical protein
MFTIVAYLALHVKGLLIFFSRTAIALNRLGEILCSLPTKHRKIRHSSLYDRRSCSSAIKANLSTSAELELGDRFSQVLCSAESQILTFRLPPDILCGT